MIPRIETGNSFKGAGLYYLHDKRREGEAERLTTDRVAWTHSFNTMEDDPEQILWEMQHTAMQQQWLKQQSGNRVDGRPTEKAVMTVSLSWPHDQKPDREEMINTAEEFLAHMRWSEHQALLVNHNDTKHTHIHLIVNRIHPETGMTIDDKWYKTRSQQWALGFERQQGKIYCQAREERYGRDAGREPDTQTYREWQTWREITKDAAFDMEHRAALKGGEWEVLKEAQRNERIDYWNKTGKQRLALGKEIREAVRFEFSHEWKVYAQEKQKRVEKARLYDLEARRAKRELRREVANPAPSLRNKMANASGKKLSRRLWDRNGARKIEERQAAYHARIKDDLVAMRADIAGRQKKRVIELATSAFAKLGKDRAEAYKGILAKHRTERGQLTVDQKKGVRRPDLLAGLSKELPPAVDLTAAQKQAYLHSALRKDHRSNQFKNAVPEVAAKAETPKRAEPATEKPANEASDRSLEKRDKDQSAEARREGLRTWYLAKRKNDREREGGGGRQR